MCIALNVHWELYGELVPGSRAEEGRHTRLFSAYCSNVPIFDVVGIASRSGYLCELGRLVGRSPLES